jgi:hypothetical protein
MKAPASSSPFRKFLRGLTNTGLLLLLPVQLMLAWVADLDQPTRMPDFLTERITAQLAEQGVRLQARRFSPHHIGPNCRQVLYLPPANSSLLNVAKARCSSAKV